MARPPQGRRPAIAQYRECSGPSEVTEHSSLQTSLRGVWDRTFDGRKLSDDVTSRIYKASENSNWLLNYAAPRSGYFFGQFALVKPGSLVALIKQVGEGAAELPILQDTPAKGNDLLHGLLYFIAVGNHLIVVESPTVRSASLAAYLSWLFGPQKADITDGSNFSLNADVQMRFDDDSSDLEIREAVLRTDVQKRRETQSLARATQDSSEKSRILQSLEAVGDRGRKVLEALGANEADLAKIREQLSDEAIIEVIVQLRARERGKSRAIDSSLINDLMNVSADDELELRGPSGRRIGEIARLKHKVQIQTVGDLLDRTDVERALHEAYNVFVNNGQIDGAG